jgi:hypothetical protein
MQIFVFLHILTMFLAVTVSFGPEVLDRLAIRTREVSTIRSAFRLHGRIGPAIPILFLLGAAFGLVAVFTGGFNPFRPWLLIAYVVFILALVNGGAIMARWGARVGALAQASPMEAPSAELAAAIDDPRIRAAFWIEALLLTAVIFDMVIKPFS